MPDDKELLRQYAEGKSETAFGEFVRRHVSFVYSVALRRVGGDVHLAQDVTQRVFADLARKSTVLFRHRAINGWLFVSTRYAAAEAVRRERKRKEREQEAIIFHQAQLEGPPESEWEHLRPGLDDLVGKLAEKDREAMLLRFVQNLSFAEIGKRLGLNENTARMRVERALEKMRGRLGRQGVKSTAGALALVLAGQSGVAVPTGLAAAATASAVASSAAGGGSLLWQFLMMNKIAVGAVVVVAAALITSLVGTTGSPGATGLHGAATAPAPVAVGQSAEPPMAALAADTPRPSAIAPEPKAQTPNSPQQAEPSNEGTASLAFYEAATLPANGFRAMTLVGARETTILYVADTPDITLQDIAHVAAVFGGNNEPVLHIKFTPEGQMKFRTLTRERSAGGKVSREAIVVDGVLISAPNIRQEIDGPLADIVSDGPNWRAMFDAFLSALPPEKQG
jgi:RNA polymerase sigma factor (sigma-70 family)